jgi:Protein of unknown function (DUF1329)
MEKQRNMGGIAAGPSVTRLLPSAAACYPRRMRTGILPIVALSVTVLAGSRSALAELPPVGTVVNKDNAEKYAEVLNPTQHYMLKHGATMPVTEYRKYEWQPVYKEATEKYASQVHLSPDGRDIVNYVAGAPFPVIDENDPQAGAKWMWNHEQGPKYTPTTSASAGTWSSSTTAASASASSARTSGGA